MIGDVSMIEQQQYIQYNTLYNRKHFHVWQKSNDANAKVEKVIAIDPTDSMNTLLVLKSCPWWDIQ